MYNLYLFLSLIFLKLRVNLSKKSYLLISTLYCATFAFIFSGVSKNLVVGFQGDYPTLLFEALNYSPSVLFSGLLFIALICLGYGLTHQVALIGLVFPFVILNSNPLVPFIGILCIQAVQRVRYANITNLLWVFSGVAYVLSTGLTSLQNFHIPLLISSIVTVIAALILTIATANKESLLVQVVKIIFGSKLLYGLLSVAGFSSTPLIFIGFVLIMFIARFYSNQSVYSGVTCMTGFWSLYFLLHNNSSLYLPIFACCVVALYSRSFIISFKTSRFVEVNYLLPRIILSLSILLALVLLLKWHASLFILSSLLLVIGHKKIKISVNDFCNNNLVYRTVVEK